jgi:hypothetical protein
MPATAPPSPDPISFTGLAGARIRLRRAEILLIHGGMKPCICAFAQAEAFGKLPYTDLLRAFPEIRLKEGKFNQGLMEEVLRLWAIIYGWVADSGAETHRIRLDPIGISALAFFVRVAGTQIRHGHIVSPVPKPKRLIARLIRKLEILRRRAARSAKRLGQVEAYGVASKQWRDFQAWARENFLYCRCNRPSMVSPRRLQNFYIAQCERLMSEVMAEEQLPMPTPTKLRYLARLCLRYSRRGRLAVGLPGLLKGDHRSRYVLARFLETRVPHEPENPERRRK